jgi:Acyl-coenzyme A:6-aminopenicillanic acid acyl-transferase
MTPQSTWRKIDDYPLFVMDMYEDYHFDGYLKTGILPLPPGFSIPSGGCSCFSAFNLPDQAIFGRNYDWTKNIPILLLFTHPANGYASASMVDLSLGFGIKEPSWDDPRDRQLLSLAPYIPLDGMNERGLTVALMKVPKAQAPVDPNKVTIIFLAAIRMMLDKAQTVDEAISLLAAYNLMYLQQHLLIADAHGNSAMVEFVDGEIKVIRSKKPWQVGTNFILSDNLESPRTMCPRYDTIDRTLEQSNGRISTEKTMALLKEVSQHGAAKTIFSMVYNQISGDIEIAVDRKFDRLYHYGLKMKK